MINEVLRIFYSTLRSSDSEWVVGRERLVSVLTCRDVEGQYLWQALSAHAALTIMGLPFVVSDTEPDALYIRERAGP